VAVRREKTWKADPAKGNSLFLAANRQGFLHISLALKKNALSVKPVKRLEKLG
jgi:hypothetical protein